MRHHAIGRGIFGIKGDHILIHPGTDDIAHITFILRQHIGGIHRINRNGLAGADGADNVALAALLGTHTNAGAVSGERLDGSGIQRLEAFNAGHLADGIRLYVLRIGSHAFHFHAFRNHGFFRAFCQNSSGRQCQKAAQQQRNHSQSSIHASFSFPGKNSYAVIISQFLRFGQRGSRFFTFQRVRIGALKAYGICDIMKVAA